MDAVFYLGLIVALIPWIVLLKMARDLKSLVSLESYGRPSIGKHVSGTLAPSEQGSLLERLRQESVQSSAEGLPESIGWDLEVIIPAYNEELNIETCVNSLAASALLLFAEHRLRTRVIVVDDNSTDKTSRLAKSCQKKLAERLQHPSAPLADPDRSIPVTIEILEGQKRPDGELWLGKNWACHVGFHHSKSQNLFFVDADVSVKDTFFTASVNVLKYEHQFAGYVSRIVCKSLLDYIVQPTVAVSSLIINNITTSLQPHTQKPHAFGQCIYISRQAYEISGGYKAANEDSMETRGLETRALAKNIVRAGISAINVAGGGLIQVYMYHDAHSMWEGWTKNFFMSVDQSLFNATTSIVMILVLYDLPLLLAFQPAAWIPVLLFIAGHFAIRLLAFRVYKAPLRGWYLFPLGGLAMTVIMIGSIYKVTSGKNWTWKGRSLSLAPARIKD
jgi:glycosyltransferase involved in cell wall biosynthesis